MVEGRAADATREPASPAPSAPELELERMLLAVRNVNRLLVRESDPQQLITRACETLTSALGFYNAWIAVGVEPGAPPRMTASSGLGEDVVTVCEALVTPDKLTCARRARSEDALVVIRDPVTECPDCPLASRYAKRAAFSHRLAVDGQVLGMLTVSVPAGLAEDLTAQGLMEELAEDLGVALHRLEVDARMKQLEHLVHSLPRPVTLMSADLHCLAVNESFAELVGRPISELVGASAADVWGPELYASVQPGLSSSLEGDPVRCEVRTGQPGRPRWLELEHVPRKDASGEVAWVVTHGLDVTNRRRTEFERELTLRLLEALGPEDVAEPDERAVAALLGEAVGGPVEVRLRISETEATGHLLEGGFLVKLGAASRRLGYVRVPPDLEDRCDARTLSFLGELGASLTIALERRRMLRRIRETEGRFTKTFRSAPALMTLSTVEDGLYLDVNDSFVRITGYSREVAVGRTSTALGFISVEQRRRLAAALRADGEVRGMELALRRADGSELWCLYSGVLIEVEGATRVLSIAIDITQSRRAEMEREHLLQAMEQSADSVSILGADKRIQYVNSTFEKSSGVARERAQGTVPAFLQSPAHDEAFYAGMWEVLDRGAAWRGRITIPRSDGAAVIEDFVISPIRDGEGATTSYVAVSHDVTERLALEEQLQHARKMEAVGQLTGGVAHDFNNLLQIMNGSTELAMMDIEDDHPARPSLDEVLESGMRASRLVKQLLLFSRRQVLQPAVHAPDEVLEELLKMLRRVIGEHIELVVRPNAGAARIFADRGMVEQVLLNLCVNARDAMPSGGRLTISTYEKEMTAELALDSVAPARGFAVMEVADTGVGMSHETLEHIFEPFFTTKEAGHGTGLGLATVYGVLRQHGGWVKVDSALGRGSVFRLYWPQHEGEATPAAPEAEARSPVLTDAGSGTILLAEDDPDVRRVTQRMLERSGYVVLPAEDGLEAVRIYEQHREIIDLVILDAVMPRMGGREAYRAIGALGGDPPVIFASGYSEGDLGDEVDDRGRVRLVPKPFNREALLAAVRESILGD